MTFLTAKQLAERWQLTEKHLYVMRHKKVGPKFTKIGGAIRYRLDHVEEYEERATT